MSHMEICFYRHSLFSRGGDKMFLFYANALAEKGHSVSLLVNEINTLFTISHAVKVKRIPLPGKIGTLLYALIKKKSADVIIADIIPLITCLSLCNRKVVYFAQDLDTSYYTSKFQVRLIKIMYWLCLGLGKKSTIAVSHSLAEELHGFGAANIDVVPNGIDIDVFCNTPDQKLLSLKQERKALLLHVRSDYRKGFDIACKVVETMCSKSVPEFEIWTVGEPCNRNFLSIRHHDFGYVDEKRLSEIMSSADIFLYPSRHEGMALMPLEAMACGCPVVTTKAVTYARHGENAFVAPVGDYNSLTRFVSDLLQNPHSYNYLSRQGKLFAQQNSLSESVREFESILAAQIKDAKRQ